MKKFFTFFAALLLSVSCFSQLQNGNFETWNSLQADMPQGWFNSNRDALSRGLPANVTKFTPAHTGDFSILLGTEIVGTDTLFGYISNSPDPFSGVGGVPYTMQPDSFNCHARLGILTGDTGIILVVFKKAGSPIGFNLLKITGNNPMAWQKLGFKLNALSMAPDTVIIAASSSNAVTETGMQHGSFIVLDNLSFNTTQPIPFAGFETWTPLNIEYPSYFVNPNTGWVLSGFNPPVMKTTDAYLGNYALKMKTQSGGPGWMFTGFNNGHWNQAEMDYSGGFAYNLQVDTLIGWYKYMPTDTAQRAQVNINFQNGDTSFAFLGIRLKNADTFTKFEIPFDLSMAPDTGIITINSSEHPVGIEDTGSILIIDEIQFKSAPLNSGVHPFSAEAKLFVGPNPTTGDINIMYIPQHQGLATFSIYNNAGMLVNTGILDKCLKTITLSGCSKGLYLLNIIDGDITISRKILLQ